MTAGSPISIVLADDHAIVRTALRRLLEAEPGLTVLAEAGDVEEARRRLLGHKPDVLLLDLTMPGGSSLEAIPELHAASPHTAVIVLTMEDEPRYARAALRAGALGFVLKEAAESSLVEAVHAAVRGERYLDPRLGAAIAAESDDGRGPGALTARETDVLRLVALGHTNAEVAEQLHLGVRTVESHRTAIGRKTGASGRAALVAYARAHGILDETT